MHPFQGAGQEAFSLQERGDLVLNCIDDWKAAVTRTLESVRYYRFAPREKSAS